MDQATSELNGSRADRVATARPGNAGVLPFARAVNEAMRHVQDDHGKPWDADRLASAVGVTGPTLRKNFKASLGVTVTEYVSAVRLEWAHERLSSGREYRSIADLAIAAGFRSSTMFTRAYLRRFGEAPSRTRALSVRVMT
ncbi:MAG: AraC family transcriptional regulator [Pseudomonadota bacterium]|uniref:helix-turn-helix transcriptional regulator n=1 Tax=Sphingomonas sp. ERG5 TaxID=1381597 RepID=UPI00054B6574|nr:AraC family transcriptional regulator [Sphingomonas sp. ERG5]